MTGTIERRSLLKTAALAVALAPLGAPLYFDAAYAAEDELRIMDGGGVWEEAARKAFYEPFQSAHHIPVKYASGLVGSVAQLKAMVQAGVIQWDLINLSMPNLVNAGELGLLEPLDYSHIDTKDWPPGSTTKYGFGLDYDAHIFAYNTDTYTGNHVPQKPADFFDLKAFPGTRSLGDRPFDTLEFALVADGVAPDKLFPLDFDRAFKKLDTIRSHVHWWTAFPQQTQWVLDREVDMIGGFNGRFQAAIDQGAPYRIVWYHGLLGVEGWGIVKGSPNRGLAQAFLQLCADPKRQAIFSSIMAFGPSNPEAFKYMKPSRAAVMPNYPTHMHEMGMRNAEWVAHNAAVMVDKWQQWKLT